MITKAEAVIAAFNEKYAPANCCVVCYEEKMNFAAAAMSPLGQRHGLCHTCYLKLRHDDPLEGFRKYVEPVLKAIKRGDYD